MVATQGKLGMCIRIFELEVRKRISPCSDRSKLTRSSAAAVVISADRARLGRYVAATFVSIPVPRSSMPFRCYHIAGVLLLEEHAAPPVITGVSATIALRHLVIRSRTNDPLIFRILEHLDNTITCREFDLSIIGRKDALEMPASGN